MSREFRVMAVTTRRAVSLVAFAGIAGLFFAPRVPCFSSSIAAYVGRPAAPLLSLSVTDELWRDRDLDAASTPIEQTELDAPPRELDFRRLGNDAAHARLAARAPCYLARYAWRDGELYDNVTTCGRTGQRLFGETYSAADAEAVAAWLYEAQHPPVCKSSDILRISQYHYGGIGATMHFIMYSVSAALARGYTVVYDTPQRPENFAWADCPLGTPECYFEPISSCAASDDQEALLVPYPPSRLIPEQWAHKPWNWWRAHVMAYIMRPNAATAAFIRHQAALVFPRGLPSMYFSIFVRRTDKVQEANVYGTDTYAIALKRLSRAAPAVRDVYFNSDDPDIFHNVSRVFAGFRVSYMAMDRGFALIMLSNFTAEQIGTQMRLSLTDLFLEAHADAHVGTLSSNWLRLVDELRMSAGKLAFPFVDVEGIHYGEMR